MHVCFLPFLFFSTKWNKKNNQKIIFQARFDGKGEPSRDFVDSRAKPRGTDIHRLQCALCSLLGFFVLHFEMVVKSLDVVLFIFISLKMLLNIYLRVLFLLVCNGETTWSIEGERKICILLKFNKLPGEILKSVDSSSSALHVVIIILTSPHEKNQIPRSILRMQ